MGRRSLSQRLLTGFASALERLSRLLRRVAMSKVASEREESVGDGQTAASEPTPSPSGPPAHWLERARSQPPAHWLDKVREQAPQLLQPESQSASKASLERPFETLQPMPEVKLKAGDTTTSPSPLPARDAPPSSRQRSWKGAKPRVPRVFKAPLRPRNKSVPETQSVESAQAPASAATSVEATTTEVTSAGTSQCGSTTLMHHVKGSHPPQQRIRQAVRTVERADSQALPSVHGPAKRAATRAAPFSLRSVTTTKDGCREPCSSPEGGSVAQPSLRPPVLAPPPETVNASRSATRSEPAGQPGMTVAEQATLQPAPPTRSQPARRTSPSPARRTTAPPDTAPPRFNPPGIEPHNSERPNIAPDSTEPFCIAGSWRVDQNPWDWDPWPPLPDTDGSDMAEHVAELRSDDERGRVVRAEQEGTRWNG